MQLHGFFEEHPRETMENALWIFANSAPELNEFTVATNPEEYSSHFANCIIMAIKPPYRVKTQEELAEEDTSPGKKMPKPH